MKKAEPIFFIIFSIFLLFFQSSNFFHEYFLVKTIKPNFLYVMCVLGIFRYSWQFLMFYTLLIGFFLDCISGGVFGVYMISFFCSIVPMIWIRGWVLQLELPIFLLVLFFCYGLKSGIEVILVLFLYGKHTVSSHLLRISIPEILLTIPLSGIFFLGILFQKILLNQAFLYIHNRVGKSKKS